MTLATLNLYNAAKANLFHNYLFSQLKLSAIDKRNIIIFFIHRKAGEIYSIVAYLWTFVTATEYLPELMESWTSLHDISKRIKAEE